MRAVTRRRAAAALAAAVAIVVALTGCSAPAPEVDSPPQVEGAFSDDAQQQLQAAVEQAMGATGATGAIVGVWAPWSGSWVAGLGTQTPGGAAVEADMQFRIGQLTRPMTCDVLYAVAGEGLVALDAPVSDYVSGVADLDDVTLEQLCDSTSGIGMYTTQLSPLMTSNPYRVWNPREVVSYGLGRQRTSEPGAALNDSDTGYVLLGLALERATGRSAASLIQQYVSRPLGLSATALPSGAAAVPAGGAGPLTGLLSVPGADGAIDCASPVDVSAMSASIGFTDSGVVSNVEDLRTYVQALAAGSLIPEAMARERLEGALPAWGGAPSWLSAAGGVVQAGSLVGNYGSVRGYSTAAFADPTTGLTVVVVLNNSVSGSGPALFLAWELAALASKLPAATGETAPEAGLPWTAEQQQQAIVAGAVCPPAS
ncbi:MAG: serine hydrolase domain-containing protein [Microbacterium sp.]